MAIQDGFFGLLIFSRQLALPPDGEAGKDRQRVGELLLDYQNLGFRIRPITLRADARKKLQAGAMAGEAPAILPPIFSLLYIF